jgi:hypothetical protein
MTRYPLYRRLGGPRDRSGRDSITVPSSPSQVSVSTTLLDSQNSAQRDTTETQHLLNSDQYEASGKRPRRKSPKQAVYWRQISG